VFSSLSLFRLEPGALHFIGRRHSNLISFHTIQSQAHIMIHFLYFRIIFIAALAYLAAPVKAAPTPVITGNIAPRASNSSGFIKQNGLTAQKLNLEFASLQQSDSCTGKHRPRTSSCPYQCR
jgi:hypothetical protein